jgi:hypothetical protein
MMNHEMFFCSTERLGNNVQKDKSRAVAYIADPERAALQMLIVDRGGYSRHSALVSFTALLQDTGAVNGYVAVADTVYSYKAANHRV